MADFLGMSDEDFLKQNGPETSPAAEEVVEAPATEAPVVEPVVENEPEAATPPETEETDPVGSEAPVEEGEAAKENNSVTKEAAPATTEPPKEASPAQSEGKTPTSEVAAPNYEEFYKQIMTPFKANGKTVELKDPKEAIQLMQMGANYTKKMQDLVPHRKVLLMLENNGLLDEGKIEFAIDLVNKNPEAIKKLLKDSGVDPMEIDTTTEPAYREGNHRVTDAEASFRAALDDIEARPSGKETIQRINADWDQASKNMLWEAPAAMAIIHEQRENGIYDRIAAEVNRQKTLGQLAPETPFLHAYKAVGDQMVQANAFADLADKQTPVAAIQPPAAPSPAVVATRVATPKPGAGNADRVHAAAPTRTTPPKNKEYVNPLSMSDDEFLKQMANRV